jgi:hypothetical protein
MPYIYLIHCRASVNAKENVYKIGKSVDFNKRLDGYDKGSIPIFTIYVCECDDFERLLITIFRSKFIIRADYGSEYFEGNINVMINTILEEYNKTELSYNVSNVVENVDVQKTETPNNVIKTKILLKNKLNKVTLQSLNDFQNNINMNSSEISSNQYFCMLNNHIQNYRMDKQSGRTNLKFGDYIDSNYAFINNLCTSLLSTHDENNIKLIERLKISV